MVIKNGLMRSVTLAAGVFLILMLTIFSIDVIPAKAQDGTCMGDVCPVSSPCTANDTSISIVRVYEVLDYCENVIDDTGTYRFVLQFVTTSKERYDETVWIALDGSNARYGDCYSDYLTPDLAPDTGNYGSLFDFWGPYWDLEDAPGSGDECGDCIQDQFTYKITDPITIECTPKIFGPLGAGGGSIDTAAAWDNQVDENCPANFGCPGTGAKCRYESSPFDISIGPIDLGLTKTASGYGDYIDPGEIFTYNLTITNTSVITAHGYTIYDDLPIWLRIVEPFTLGSYRDYYEDDGTSEDGLWGDDSAEWCAGVPGCDGYGDIVYINEQEDLAPGATRSYSFQVQFWMVPSPTWCDDYPQDLRCLGGITFNPETIDNEACVLGFEPETPLLTSQDKDNNCDSVIVPTEVRLESFTATGNAKSVDLAWVTSHEINNLGFNLYRSNPQDGDRVKINSDLIPSESPGNPEGASYSFTDSTFGGRSGLRPNVTYYYWLEAVPLHGHTEEFGPVSAELTLGRYRNR